MIAGPPEIRKESPHSGWNFAQGRKSLVQSSNLFPRTVSFITSAFPRRSPPASERAPCQQRHMGTPLRRGKNTPVRRSGPSVSACHVSLRAWVDVSEPMGVPHLRGWAARFSHDVKSVAPPVLHPLLPTVPFGDLFVVYPLQCTEYPRHDRYFSLVIQDSV